jgi:hypothetical protein
MSDKEQSEAESEEYVSEESDEEQPKSKKRKKNTDLDEYAGKFITAIKKRKGDNIPPTLTKEQHEELTNIIGNNSHTKTIEQKIAYIANLAKLTSERTDSISASVNKSTTRKAIKDELKPAKKAMQRVRDSDVLGNSRFDDILLSPKGIAGMRSYLSMLIADKDTDKGEKHQYLKVIKVLKKDINLRTVPETNALYKFCNNNFDSLYNKIHNLS